MCSIVVVRGVWHDTPLLVVANRDEALSRPAQGLQQRTIDGLLITHPVDLKAGGTWLGTNARGVFVGLTNRYSGPPDPKRRSRGELVHRLLESRSLSAAVSTARGYSAADYNPCHLVFATADEMAVLVNNGNEWSAPEVDEHLAVVTERSYGAAETKREPLIHKLIVPWLASPEAPNQYQIQRAMATHAQPTFEGICVHWDAHSYGTRTLFSGRLGRDGTWSHYETFGPPCAAPLRSFPMAET